MIAGNSGRVLIVDDEINTLKASASILKLNGIRNVVTESDSRLVMVIMNDGKLDVVLLDLFMPNISGMELLSLLQKQHPHVPVIIVTAASEMERVEECKQKGAFDYLVKPVKPDRILDTLQKAFEYRKSR